MASRARVRRPADKDDLIKSLINDQPFATMAEALVFAAALGYARGKRIPFDQSAEQVPWPVFANMASVALIPMLAAASSDDINVLGDDRSDDRLTIFEEYANGGLEIVRDSLARDTRSARDVVLDLVLEHENRSHSGTDIDLDTIAAEFAN